MPGRSPRRHATPPPPLISRHSPPTSRGRVRSPDHHHLDSRGRERREYRASVRRSRSPIATKTRSSYSPPPIKRKAVSPTRERDLSRRTKLSKSPVSSRLGSDHAAYVGTSADTVRSVSGSDRYRNLDYEKERGRAERNHFIGPEGSINFDVSELKKFTIEVIRRPLGDSENNIINRTITNPDSIAPVRRAGEGARPLFRRTEISASSSRERHTPTEDYRRIVAVAPSKASSRHSPEHSRERTRYASPPYEDTRRSYYPERVHSPYERHRSLLREDYVEPKEKHRERRAGSRDDLRRDIEVRRRDERRYSLEKINYEKESDLRMRINEKRSEPAPRHEERDYSSSRRYESERDKHSRSHHSPPPKEKRRAGSVDRHEVSRSSRGEGYEHESERRRRPHSREREDRERLRYEHSDHGESSDRSRRTQGYKMEYEPKKFYKSYEPKEVFIPPPARGRGGLPIRRGLPPVMRGRGIVRGIPARGYPIRGIPRGVPRVPFMRGFPPRFFPPY